MTWPLPSENEKGRDWGFCLPGKLEFFIEPFLLERGCCVGAYGEDALLTFLRICGQQFWGGHENEVGWDHHAELPFQEWSLKLTSFEGGGGQGKKVGEISELYQTILIISVSRLFFWFCTAAELFAHCFASAVPGREFGAHWRKAYAVFSRAGFRKGERSAAKGMRTSSERHRSYTAAGSRGVSSDCPSVYSKMQIKFCGYEYSNRSFVNFLLGFEPVIRRNLGS